MRFHYLRAAVFLLALSSSLVGAAPRPQRAATGQRSTNTAGVALGRPEPTYKDVAYADKDPAQKLDVYLARSDSPTPAVIFIHGGGWKQGTKSQPPALLLKQVRPLRLTIISVEYRLSDVAKHPAQVEDAIRAVQFIRSKAGEWNLDPKRLAVMGASAGAHLALHVGLRDDAANPRSSDPVERESSRVACVVDFFGPADFFLLRKIHHMADAYWLLLGLDPSTPPDQIPDASLKDASPVSFVSPDDPPVLMLHGTADPVVPIAHSESLEAKLREAGVKSKLVKVEGAKHGFHDAQTDEETLQFLKLHLLGEGAEDSR